MDSRLRFFDVVRGFTILSMMAFHCCYDLAYLADIQLPWFAPPFQDIWRASISWVFLTIAGIMCSFSRNNLKRGLRYGALALCIFVVTSVASVDTPISFGIIFCMSVSTMLEYVLERCRVRPYGLVAAGALFAVFLGALNVPRGTLGIGTLCLKIPHSLYSTPWFSWLGLPGPQFVSGDYYPVIPFTLLYLSGSALGWWMKEHGYPEGLYRVTCRPLEFVGRHPLLFYVAHQPVLLVLTGAM